MMLYGASTMGSCYLIASMCLRVAQKDESKEAMVSFIPSLSFCLSPYHTDL